MAGRRTVVGRGPGRTRGTVGAGVRAHVLGDSHRPDVRAHVLACPDRRRACCPAWPTSCRGARSWSPARCVRAVLFARYGRAEDPALAALHPAHPGRAVRGTVHRGRVRADARPSCEGDHYVVGTGLRTITYQIAQLAGFAGGGLVIAASALAQGLLLDAATFVLSDRADPGRGQGPAGRQPGRRGGPEHVPSRGGSGPARSRPASGSSSPTRSCGRWSAWPGCAGSTSCRRASPRRTRPRSQAAPTAVGLLMAAMPTGTALGTYLFVRWVPRAARSSWMGPLGMAAGVPLLFCAFLPNLVVSLVLWAASRPVLLLPGAGGHRVRSGRAGRPARPGRRYRLVRACSRCRASEC